MAASGPNADKTSVPVTQQHVKRIMLRLIQKPQRNQEIKLWVTFEAKAWPGGGEGPSVMKKLGFSLVGFIIGCAQQYFKGCYGPIIASGLFIPYLPQ